MMEELSAAVAARDDAASRRDAASGLPTIIIRRRQGYRWGFLLAIRPAVFLITIYASATAYAEARPAKLSRLLRATMRRRKRVER